MNDPKDGARHNTPRRKAARPFPALPGRPGRLPTLHRTHQQPPMIIDFHTHSFPEKIAARALEQMSLAANTPYFTDGTVKGLIASMHREQVGLSVNLPVMTSTGQVEKVNSALIAQADTLLRSGVLTFGGMHPDYGDPHRELRRLKEHGIRGIKLHPAYQRTDIDDIRYLRIMECASAEGLIIVTHAGLDIGFPEKNWAPVKGILNVLKEVSPEKLVLAHMGGWSGWKDAEQHLCGAPVWFDTAFSLGPIAVRDCAVPPAFAENLSCDDFARLARKHGADRILFGSDSPWERPALYRSFIQSTSLSQEEKDAIFHRNAERLLQFPCPADRTAKLQDTSL